MIVGKGQSRNSTSHCQCCWGNNIWRAPCTHVDAFGLAMASGVPPGHPPPPRLRWQPQAPPPHAGCWRPHARCPRVQLAELTPPTPTHSSPCTHASPPHAATPLRPSVRARALPKAHCQGSRTPARHPPAPSRVVTYENHVPGINKAPLLF